MDGLGDIVMLLEKWFSTPIWSDNTEFDYGLVANKCLELQKTYPNRVLSNEGGWQSQDIDLNQYDELRIVKQIIDQKIGEFSKDVNQKRFVIDNAWVNLNYPGTFNKEHVHPVVAFAGTIYISVPENSGRIVFVNDFTPIKHYPLNIENSPTFYGNVKYKPRNGMILFFPAWLSHYVERNQSNQIRISISFNVRQMRD